MRGRRSYIDMAPEVEEHQRLSNALYIYSLLDVSPRAVSHGSHFTKSLYSWLRY
jgi:hypothetical protein